MKTRVCRLYGQGDLRVETDEVPEPAPGQVLLRIGAGGICGSDLHYFQDGGFGPIRVREPIILGHEAAGTVEAAGEGVALAPGDRVALNPSRPCGSCAYCQEGKFQHCLAMRFNGSALRFPHEQGAFRDLMLADAAQCVAIGPDTSLAKAACAEPLAVCLHARNRAGELRGRRVLVTGAGPIGSLCVAAAAHAGAGEIVVTDLHDATLAAAGAMGATRAVNVAREALTEFAADKGHFDVTFECSAAAPAVRSAIECTRPLGRIVQVGVTGDLPVPINMIVGKEIELVGAHRFHAEFAEAVALIDSGTIDPTPILTRTFPVAEALEAFALAGDRTRAVKVQLSFA
ncbi:MAG: L-idonate 5-dehydrogenase [Rhodobacteraceae bacterium]|uniref:L-idonate 5-dehydrogenase n=1 Tax=Amaricoccus sp. TaxID=1872485 RepID=UPI001D4618FC|nr:L-idonate 5-dehydrogenase [Amaricoccus sp.]MCB1372899.1 L-idonate 5-dehydrogenase [Paracoccaceae bacterium]MCB1402945.1 L-idonate 5-dehydrogenase [Paracoccaceae bacterium]MCC0066615.1 L-idonate 5-dehydrogenase [Rhodovulum sp.]HRW14403.1 L-idonate 5-dehydrogenase [Amaricoccus sp.]